MKKMSWILFLFLVFFGMGPVSNLWAFMGPEVNRGSLGHRGSASGSAFSPEKMLMEIDRELKLTSAQKEAFLAGERRVIAEAKKIRVLNRELQKNIEKELFKDNPDLKVISGWMQKIDRNMTAVRLKRLENIIQFKKILRSGQLKIFKQLHHNRGPQSPKRRDGADLK